MTGCMANRGVPLSKNNRSIIGQQCDLATFVRVLFGEKLPFLILLPSKGSAMNKPVRKLLYVLTAAALVAGAALTGSAIARERHTEPTANQLADRVDAHIARMRADLHLTPEQENNWSGFESAMRDIGKSRADREIALRADRAQQKGPVDIIEQMRRNADFMTARAAEQKKLADAAQPLFASLNAQQKRRFTEELVRVRNERD
jgi:hypothetical protein